MRQQRICEKKPKKKVNNKKIKKKKLEVIQEFKTGRLLTDNKGIRVFKPSHWTTIADFIVCCVDDYYEKGR